MDVLPLGAFLLAVSANLTLTTLVIRRNRTSATSKLFALLGIVLAMWATVNYVSFITSDKTIALWTIRLVLGSAVLQSVLFGLLLHTIPQNTLPLTKKGITVLTIITAASFVVTISPLLVTDIRVQAGSPPQPIFGLGLVVFLPVVVGSLLWGTIMLIRKNLRSRGLERVQQRYVLVGLVATFGLLISLILMRALLWQDTKLVPYAPLFTIPFLSLTAYTIIRHRLMDIRAAIFRGLSLSFLVGALLLIYGALLLFAVPLAADVSGINNNLLAVAAALVSIPLAQYIQATLTRLTDRFLFQGKPDYQYELVRLGQQLSSTIKIEDVTDTVLAAMGQLLRVKDLVIFLRDPETHQLAPHATAGKQAVHIHLEQDHPLVDFLHHYNGPLVKDELPSVRERTRSRTAADSIKQVENAMQWLDAAVILPLFVNRELTGMVVLGQKLSGAPYLQDDLQFLAALAPQAATALENARLYQESLAFTQRLKLEVERATHKLAVANEQLRNLDKAKSEFLSIASHQLYTPLTALRGYVSMLQEGEFGKIAKQQQPILVILEQSAERLIELIKELLDISRIESGRLELNLESIDLAEMAEILVKDLLPNAMRKDLDLGFEVPETPLPHIVGDAQRLRQVMLNFVDNAIKYTEKGSVTVTLRRDGEDIVFAVTDTGVGLSAAEIERLFTKFTRVGGASRYHTEGTGLGLYVAKQIVQEHRGTVNVTSPGKGATFEMRLPAEGTAKSHKVGEKATVAIRAAETSASGQRERIREKIA